ncbi:MAG TPA: hypothetical protein VFI08_15305 [Spirochaetia bacterium]|nr:hypothetical protein [Spirochaetia bacterium]
MTFLVRVRVKQSTLNEFAAALRARALDNSRVRGETWCRKNEPAVGYSVWETPDRRDFDARFDPWRRYYEQVEITEVISPADAMKALLRNATESPEGRG